MIPIHPLYIFYAEGYTLLLPPTIVYNYSHVYTYYEKDEYPNLLPPIGYSEWMCVEY